MSRAALSLEQAQRYVAWVQKCCDEGFKLRGSPNALDEAARRHKLNRHTLRARINAAKLHHDLEPHESESIHSEDLEEVREPVAGLDLAVKKLLISSPRTLAELVQKTKGDTGQVLDALEQLQKHGARINRVGDRYDIPRFTAQAWTQGASLEVSSAADDTFTFGVVGDNHCGSKYERRDVLADLYDRFEKAGVTHVFHTGNWIDGDARFNRHDLLVHGIEQQCQLLAETYPKREGITTYAVAGDDHEGWYAQREGIDVGSYCEGVFRRAGREDWVHLGYMEAHVTLKNSNTNEHAIMAVVHPGGGSTYALSYAVQKIIESLEGGEKPAVGLYGHYHKLWAGNIRNVWCLVTGCCQDQTPFMRKVRTEAQVGGTLVRMEQDPETGAIIGFSPSMMRYFAQGYYSKRWSHHGGVVLPDRAISTL